jgi:putative chitobiose transport system permease protein
MNNTVARPTRNKTLQARRNVKNFVGSVILYVLLVITALLCLGPFLWLLSTSLKVGANAYVFPPQIIPWPITFHNFTEVFRILQLWTYIGNTIYMTVLGIVLNLVTCTITAYPLARINFPGRNFVFSAIVSTMVLPNAAGMIVNFIIIQKLHLYNTMLGVVLPSAISVFNVFLLRQAFITISKEMEYSGRMDGASEFRIFWNIMLPIIRPAISTVIIFDFMGFWNSFIWPVIVLDDKLKYPLAPALQYLTSSLAFNFQYIAAGTIISVIPIIVIFLILQKQFVNGMVGAVKG